MMPILVRGIKNVTINIDITILASENFKQWPLNPDDNHRFAEFMSFIDCEDIKFESRSKKGAIDG